MQTSELGPATKRRRDTCAGPYSLPNRRSKGKTGQPPRHFTRKHILGACQSPGSLYSTVDQSSTQQTPVCLQVQRCGFRHFRRSPRGKPQYLVADIAYPT